MTQVNLTWITGVRISSPCRKVARIFSNCVYSSHSQPWHSTHRILFSCILTQLVFLVECELPWPGMCYTCNIGLATFSQVISWLSVSHPNVPGSGQLVLTICVDRQHPGSSCQTRLSRAGGRAVPWLEDTSKQCF